MRVKGFFGEYYRLQQAASNKHMETVKYFIKRTYPTNFQTKIFIVVEDMEAYLQSNLTNSVFIINNKKRI